MYPGGKQARAAWSLKLNLDHERENVSCAKSTSAWPGLLCEDAPWWRQIWEGKASTRDRMVLTLMSSKSSCLCFLIVSISASSAPLKPVDSERIKIPLWKLYWGQHIMEKAAPTSQHLPSPRVMPQELCFSICTPCCCNHCTSPLPCKWFSVQGVQHRPYPPSLRPEALHSPLSWPCRHPLPIQPILLTLSMVKSCH